MQRINGKLLGIVLTAIFCGLVNTPTFAMNTFETPHVSKERVLKAIEFIEENPLDPKMDEATSLCITFATESEDVLVVLDQKYFPWVKSGEEPSQEKAILMGVFVAGNIKDQILSGVVEDRPYEGMVLMLKVYTLWRENDMVEDIVEMDAWSQLSPEELQEMLKKERPKDE